MKKFIQSLIILVAVFSFGASAQTTTTCNAEFSWQFLNSATVKFNPATVTDSPLVQHYWKFGDGSSPNTLISPTHSYAPGTYNVMHYIVRHNPNGVQVCIDSVMHQIFIQGVCNLNASFNFQAAASNPLLIYFSNTSVGLAPGDSIRWTFGDGSVSFTLNTTHTFAASGTYNVCLRISRPQTVAGTVPCQSEICHTVTIPPVVTQCNLQAYFSTDSLQSNVFHFINQSPGYLPGDSISWTFGDGTSSTAIDPTHTYTTPGVYNACLRIVRYTTPGTAPCVREYCKTIYVGPAPCNLTANFTWSAINTGGTNSIQFTNTSAPLSTTDSIRWTFGDGTSSNQINPVHAYAQPGTYNVCLRVQKRNSAGVLTDCIREICHTVVVPAPCNLVANFTSSPVTTAGGTNTIHFTNTSVPLSTTDSIRWTFGDGSSSNQVSPNHTYTQPGTYNVCLRIIKRTSAGTLSNCISEICHTVAVQAPCNIAANYTKQADPLNYKRIYFTNTSVAPAGTTATWYFGDGGTAATWNAVHEYLQAGRYNVCLRIQYGTCVNYRCDSITVGTNTGINCNNITLGFTDVRDSLMPNRIKFTAVSNAATTDQVWTITRVPATSTTGTATIHLNNPIYVFADSGYYRVCLRATFAGGCIKEYCRTIHIEHPIPTTTYCSLQVYPNPASTVINATITLAQPLLLNAYVYNSMNMLVAQKQQQGAVGVNTVTVPIGTLPAGVYRIRLVYGNHACYNTFLKQ